ncbi:hypothetical protein C1645_822470 [Glomus cerebriforme]|uniref:Uncharacterized protein n=1 Tax=Glomus cerebriforme TaxID=658196 RepID=A0A397T4S0_9GLOM|nr:hypothetical protein C1645_822470 [Glomus cerebriforme]
MEYLESKQTNYMKRTKLFNVNSNDTDKFIYLNQLLILRQQNDLKKRLKSKERSPDKANDIAVRSEMKHILKGQIPDEYALDYDKIFIKQSNKIYKKLIPELKKLMSGHYNPLLKYLLRDVLDPTAEEIQHAKKQWERIYDNDTYFTYSKLPENTPEWVYDAEKSEMKQWTSKCSNIYRVNDNNDKMTQYDDASLTDPNLDYLLNSAEINLIRPEDLDEISKSSQSDIILDAVNMKYYCTDLLCRTVPLYDRDFYDHSDLNDSSDINDLSDS